MFDTLAAAETRAHAGAEDPHAGVARDSREGLATTADIERLEDRIEMIAANGATRADLYRALWIQTGIAAAAAAGFLSS